jgi:hypothetical protein
MDSQIRMHRNPNLGKTDKRDPNEVINGTTFYRLQFESEAEWYDVYGTVTPDAEHQIVVEWKFHKTIVRKEAEASRAVLGPKGTSKSHGGIPSSGTRSR